VRRRGPTMRGAIVVTRRGCVHSSRHDARAREAARLPHACRSSPPA
jgi:hypothetical protein